MVKLYKELQYSFSAYRLIMVYICIKFGKNIKGFQSYGAKRHLILFITKGHNSLKIIYGVKVLFSAHHLIMVYICAKFRENILNGFKLWSVHNFNVITKEYISVKMYVEL